jgi:recombination protein RecA
MTDDKQDKLALVIAGIQKRWGTRVIGRSAPKKDFPAISTSFPHLDEALGIGGIPRGRISELVGTPTSGMATLALKIVAQAQKEGASTVYLDLTRTFDPAYAWRCGVQLANLTLVHPYTFSQSLSILSDFIMNGGIDLLIFDNPLHLQDEARSALKLSSTLGSILAPLSRNNSTLLFLTSLSLQGRSPYPEGATLPYYATLRLLLSKERWLYGQQDVRGYEAQVLVIKNKLHRPGQKVRLNITFNGTVEGDSL